VSDSPRNAASKRKYARSDGLFRASERDDVHLAAAGERMAVMTPGERADAAAHIYLPVTRAGGILLYQLVRAIQPTTVVEFGMSFGISTLYLAAAVRDNGAGEVITTEMSPDKITAAEAFSRRRARRRRHDTRGVMPARLLPRSTAKPTSCFRRMAGTVPAGTEGTRAWVTSRNARRRRRRALRRPCGVSGRCARSS
jgi:hypothetical protein